ncbi:MAG: hypothetical protein AAGD05_01170 [Bacteroidota bacterium]
MNQLKLRNGAYPEWGDLEDGQWQAVLKNYFFLNANRFGFDNVESKKDLFPPGLKYFNDWELVEIGFVKIHQQIVGQFELNTSCKEKLLTRNFVTHQKNNFSSGSRQELGEDHFNYEFDILYFFNDLKLIGTYINHEQQILFNCEEEFHLLKKLDQSLQDAIIDEQVLIKAFQK